MNLLGLYSSTLDRLMFGVCWVYQKRVSLRSGSTWSERSSERRPRRLLVENYPITPGQRLSGLLSQFLEPPTGGLHLLHFCQSSLRVQSLLRRNPVGCGHTIGKAPEPVRFQKLSPIRLCQYWGGRPPGNAECRILLSKSTFSVKGGQTQGCTTGRNHTVGTAPPPVQFHG